MTDTPETNKAEFKNGKSDGKVPADFARKLERERNALLEALRNVRKHCLGACAQVVADEAIEAFEKDNPPCQ